MPGRRLRVSLAAATALLSLLATPAAAAACGPVEEMPDEGHHHLVSGAEPPVPYRSLPPSSGWHFRERGEIHLGVADEALSEPQQVGVLAVHGVVVTYRDLPDEERAALETFVEGLGSRPVALTPYDELEPGEVALTAWGLRQVCTGVDLAAVEAFVTAHAADEPDFGMSALDHADHGDHAAAAPSDTPAESPARDPGPLLPVAVAGVIAVGAIITRVLVQPRSE